MNRKLENEQENHNKTKNEMEQRIHHLKIDLE